MNWVERQGILFSGEYRICKTTRGDWDVWYYAQTQNGILKRGFQTSEDAKRFSEQHEFKERSLLASLDAVSLKV